jgi:hypothetical protein
MLIAVGMYLPFTTTFAIFVGGIIKYAAEKIGDKQIQKEPEEKHEEMKSRLESFGLLIASGLVAGEALVGILLAILVVSNIKLNEMLGNLTPEGKTPEGFAILGFLIFAILAFVMIYFPVKAMTKKEN